MENSVKSIYVALHGDKFNGQNPGMTEKGFEQVAALRPLLPQNPSAIVCGTGKRHIDVATALGLKPTRYTPSVGGPESLETVDGKVCVVLADGTAVPRGTYTGTDDGKSAMVAVVASLPDNAVICAGRPSMILLGVENAKSAAVYKVEVAAEPIRTKVGGGLMTRKRAGEILSITEVIATGEAELHTV